MTPCARVYNTKCSCLQHSRLHFKMESTEEGTVDDITETDISNVKVNVWGDEENDTDQKQIIMSVLWAGGKLGVSHYVVETAHLYLMHDKTETVDFELLKRVLMEVQPSIVLISSKQDDLMKNCLHNTSQQTVEEECDLSFHVDVLPSTEFKYEICSQRILSFPLPGIPTDCTDEERAIKLSSIVPPDSVNMVRTFGALIKYLEKNRIGMELEDTSTRVPVLALKTFTLDNLVQMDENAFRSLQIFHQEAHPSVYKNSSGGKEGLSMYGIADHTRSPMGRKMLKLWMMRPLHDVTTLQERQEAISFLMNTRHVDVLCSLRDCLKHIKNIPRILVRMNSSQSTNTDWRSLYETVYNGILIGDLCKSLPQNIAVFKNMAAVVTGGIHRIASLISRIVDFDESSMQNRFVVNSGVDSQLDAKKHMYSGLPDLMTKVAKLELEKLDDSIKRCSVIHLPQLGYLLTFHCPKEMSTSGDFTMPEMDFMFISEGIVHYKTAAIRELDHILGDTQSEINDIETTIMHQLQTVVIEQTDALLLIVEWTAVLDCLIALTTLAKEQNFVKPELTEDNVIYIKSGRHPLQELCVSPFVPNDTCCDSELGRMKLLTGPNASGKSIYLKQVGLIVYLAHIGSFVPAEAAKIGMMNGIYTRIQTMESISVKQSSFLIDLNQVSVAVHNSTGNSLVLMDEFGKGTATVDGVSLLVATLHHWLARGQQCPNVFVSTHFHSVIQQKLLPKTRLIEYLMMQTMREGAELVFLYQLVKGTCDNSYACHLASSAGLPADIISRAADVSDLMRKNEPLRRKDFGHDSETKNKRCADIVSRFLELNLEKDDIGHFLKEYVVSAAGGIF